MAEPSEAERQFRALLADEHRSAARRALAAQPGACDACLGRGLAKLGTGLLNAQRGRALREALGQAPGPAIADCAVCEGLPGQVGTFAELALAALEGWEHRTFLIGTRVDDDVLDREAALQQAAGLNLHEPVTSELNRETGKRVAAVTGKPADPKKPDVAVVVDTRFDVTELQVAPVFLYARYRKLVRDLPQTRWPCRQCRGRGCVKCGMTGKQYPTSVQELVQAPAIAAFQARDADFHGMGREDIDARCLGPGRPFVLELREPRRRTADLAVLEGAMNAGGAGRVEVLGLRWSERDEVAWVKQADAVKEYRAVVEFEGAVDEAKLYQALAGLRAGVVAQRTPSRVEHRRAMLTRQRVVHDIALERLAPQEATLRIRGQAGLYIKELVSGDGGRTRPSLAELLGVPARVRELDVIDVAEPPRPAKAGPARAEPQAQAPR